jgi:hypothetical protein
MSDKLEELKVELEDKIAAACGKVEGRVGAIVDLVRQLTAQHQAEIADMKIRIAAAEECCHRAERIAKGIK